jgi:IS30 family transposase
VVEDHKYNDYHPVCAQEFYRRRRQSLQLLMRRPELKAFIVSRLRSSWSTGQIAGYLRQAGKGMGV